LSNHRDSSAKFRDTRLILPEYQDKALSTVLVAWGRV
jgi:hypothetical protein